MVYRSREFSHMAFPNHQEGIDRFYLGTNTFYMPIWALTGVVRGSHDEMAAKVRKLTLESCLWFSRVGLVEALRRFPNVTHITLELPVGGVTAYAYASDVETCNGEDVGIDDLADIEQMHLIQAFMYDIDKNLDKLRETQIIIIGEDGQRYDSLYPGYPTWVRGVERQFQRWIYEGRRGKHTSHTTFSRLQD